MLYLGRVKTRLITGGFMSAIETEKELSVYESMAARFDVAARKLNLDDGLYKYMRCPNREIIVHIPVEMDNGTLRFLMGIASSTASLAAHPKGECASARTSL